MTIFKRLKANAEVIAWHKLNRIRFKAMIDGINSLTITEKRIFNFMMKG